MGEEARFALGRAFRPAGTGCTAHRCSGARRAAFRSSLACSFQNSFRATSFREVLLAPHSKRSSASDLVCEANTKHEVWISRCAPGSAPAVSPIVHARSAQVGIGERDSRRAWGQQLLVRGQLHSPMGKLVMRVAHVAPIRARCFNSKRTSFHVALELEHVESVDLRSAIRKADAVLPAFAREGQRGHTV